MRCLLFFAALLPPALVIAAPIPSLKEAAAPDFLVGVALGGRVPLPDCYSSCELRLIQRQFNAVTPENCMKPAPVHPAEDTWNFDQADALVSFARQNRMAVFGHALVWHQQCPEWFFKDGEHDAPRALVLARLKRHVETLVGRYRGGIRGWDVVNEALSDQHERFLRDTPWLKAIGPDYIAQAFLFARVADPDAQLQINDYSIVEPEKRAKMIRLIKQLQARNVPVDSVGIQGHWELDQVPFQDIADTIDAFSALGLKVAITELDLDVLPRNEPGADIDDQRKTADAVEARPCPPDILRRQAEQYGKLFALFREHGAQLVRVSFWGLHDGRSWLNNWPTSRHNFPLLFDRQLHPKPAYDAVIRALTQPVSAPRTSGLGNGVRPLGARFY